MKTASRIASVLISLVTLAAKRAIGNHGVVTLPSDLT